jgi:hypothetical protein
MSATATAQSHEDAVRAALTGKRSAKRAHREATDALDTAVIAALRAGGSHADIAEWSGYDPRWVARLAEIYVGAHDGSAPEDGQ